MPTFTEMSLEEIEAMMTQLRDRRRALKKTGKVAERRIATLEKRRGRLVEQVKQLSEQIEALRREANVAPVAAPKRRGRRPKSAMITAE